MDTDSLAKVLLSEIDGVARDTDHYEYGLPLFNDEVMSKLTGLVVEAMKNSVSILAAECDKLQAFKDYVHRRLNIEGVPADPDSPHKAEGCRIGGRLDELFRERDRLREALKPFADYVECRGDGMPDDTPMDPIISTIRSGPTLGDCRRAAELLAPAKKA